MVFLFNRGMESTAAIKLDTVHMQAHCFLHGIGPTSHFMR